MEFNLKGKEGEETTEGVLLFKYLGRPLDQSDDDCPASTSNIGKSRQVWGRLGITLRR